MGANTTSTINGKPDAGPWVHVTDGTTCDVFLAPHGHPSECTHGHTDVQPDLWWCTEHQSHLRTEDEWTLSRCMVRGCRNTQLYDALCEMHWSDRT